MKKSIKCKNLIGGFLIVLGLMLYTQAFAQEVTVTGKVTDAETNIGLPGVTIIEKGTEKGTITDADGNYSITVSYDATLVFSFVGMQTKEVKVGDSKVINIEMIEMIEHLEEVVVTGYMLERKVDLTGAVSLVDEEDILRIPANNPLKSLQGRVPGLYIETTGEPSTGVRTILIRGLNTLGNNSPLFVIDGISTKGGAIEELNPAEIESIQVLKDASASSIYGARASNGVIIVTTKTGGSDKIKVQFNSNITMQKYPKSRLEEVCNTEELGRVFWRASVNDGLDPNNQDYYNYTWHTDAQGNPVLDNMTVEEWVDETRGIKSADTDWYDEILRRGMISSNNLSISSGGERSGLLLSLTYYANNGIIKTTDFNRLSGRINTYSTFFDGKLKIGENFQMSKNQRTPTPSGRGGNSLSLAQRTIPLLPVYTVDGEWAGPVGALNDEDNPVMLLEINKWDKRRWTKTFGNVYAEVLPIKNLLFRSSFGIDWTEVNNRDIQRKYTAGFLSRSTNSLDNYRSTDFDWVWSNTLNYQLEYQNHRASFLAGMEAIKEDFYSVSAYREDFPIEEDDYFYINAGVGESSNSGSSSGHQLLSYFGKVNYSLSNKYLVSLTLRYDGSSRFGDENKFGFFPAMSLGWRLSSEDFFRENIDFISFLQLRFGMGRVGNQEIGNSARFDIYSVRYQGKNSAAYDIEGNDGGLLPSGYVATQTANPNLKWETTEEINAGIDFSLLNQKITGSFDYFQRETYDILIKPPYAAVIGEGGSQWINGATIDNKGFEAVLGYTDRIGDLVFDISTSISSFHDKITYLPPSVVDAYAGNVEKTILGHSQSSLFGYVTDGIFQNPGEVDSHATQAGKGTGRLRFTDLNEDGIINSLDQDWLGTGLPDFIYGINIDLSYKGFNFSAFLQGVHGIEVYNLDKIRDMNFRIGGENRNVRALDAWTPENTDSPYPAVSLSDNNNERRYSNYFIENGSYLKLRNLQLGYTIPTEVTKKLGVNNLQVYIHGANLFILKDNKGDNQFTSPDPENPAGKWNPSYPRSREIGLGLNVTF
ncbi:MAG: SusC/RagA family TonB-linked outer membrane protein [Bacteroidetes bacterium]|nr:SusC/RagA family TonB-linked outer membrane protein [Bacteroidota bacterium]